MGNDSWADWSQRSSESATLPQTPPEHAASLLQRDGVKKDTPQKLFQPQMLLGNIKNDYLIFLEARSYELLHDLYFMVEVEEEFRPMFDTLYETWVGKVRFTCIKDGGEREYQANIGGHRMVEVPQGYDIQAPPGYAGEQQQPQPKR